MQKLHGHFAYYGITVLFAQLFLIAGRGRRKPGGILGQVRSGLSVALEYLETIGGIDLSRCRSFIYQDPDPRSLSWHHNPG